MEAILSSRGDEFRRITSWYIGRKQEVLSICYFMGLVVWSLWRHHNWMLQYTEEVGCDLSCLSKIFTRSFWPKTGIRTCVIYVVTLTDIILHVLSDEEKYYKGHQCYMHIYPSSAESRIFQKNQVNTLVADALAPCISIVPEVIILAMYYELVFVFDQEGFDIPISSKSINDTKCN